MEQYGAPARGQPHDSPVVSAAAPFDQTQFLQGIDDPGRRAGIVTEMAGQPRRRVLQAVQQRHQCAPLHMGHFFILEDRLHADARELIRAFGQIADRAFGIEFVGMLSHHIAALAMVA